MGRRPTTYLLLLAMLLSQWAWAVRCVGSCSAGGPERRPHVHLDAILPGQHHEAASSCSCRRHATPEPPVGSGVGTPGTGVGYIASEPAPGDQPDGRVLYLSSDAGIGLRAGVVFDGSDPVGMVVLSPLSFDTDPAPVGTRHPSPQPPPRRPLYLLTHSLLI